MTPQERQLVTDLFDRLEKLETAPRNADAERLIADELRRAPHAVYALVQTVLVQDEALKRADARIRELGGEAPQEEGFLDGMRRVLTGGSGRGSVPSVRPAGSDPRWNTGGAVNSAGGFNTPAPMQQQPQSGPFGGGSFLGTAAASAAGVIGGAILYNSISSLFSGGHRSGSAFADTQSQSSPWDSNATGGDLSRDAGLNDVGTSRSAGLFGDASNDDADFGDSSGGDFGGDFGGDSA